MLAYDDEVLVVDGQRGLSWGLLPGNRDAQEQYGQEKSLHMGSLWFAPDGKEEAGFRSCE
ncbi:MAG: hypothetical protein DMG69_14575 [Acidobacteria bacterium]|nr:MAG: hypothetical protein DMG69_14575 [Acidobacteriota bacterium]